MNILKFGGSFRFNPSKNQSCNRNCKTLFTKGKIAIVHSAFGGVTDLLINMSNKH